MPKTSTKKKKAAAAVCKECGSDIREGTQFCYNCGLSLTNEPPKTVAETLDETVEERPIADEIEIPAVDEIKIPTVEEIESPTEQDAATANKSVLDELAERLKTDEEENEKLAKAATERKRSRSSVRKSKTPVWEPNNEYQNGLVLVISLLIGLIAAVAVFVTVYWK